jgi:hypothetical protein
MILSKPLAFLFSAVTLMAILWPVRENWHKKPKDNFPLSYFPMFSHQRDSINTVNYFVGYDSLGQRYYIPYDMIGSGGFNQVRRQINRKVKTEKGEKLVQKVAKKLSQSPNTPYCHLVRVALVQGDFHLDNYFLQGEKTPLSEKIISTQTIERP